MSGCLVSEGTGILMTRSVSSASALDQQSDGKIREMRDGSAQELESIYRAQRGKLLRRLARKTGFERAEDIVQQVFLRLAGRPGLASDIETPANYLAAATSNALRDAERASIRQHAESHVTLDDAVLPDCDPIRHLEARDRLARIEKALTRMKPLTRDIFLARRLDGYSYSEIAQKTGLSVRGVEKQMSRALAQLSRFRDDE